jgi:hypothetical protein
MSMCLHSQISIRQLPACSHHDQHSPPPHMLAPRLSLYTHQPADQAHRTTSQTLGLVPTSPQQCMRQERHSRRRRSWWNFCRTDCGHPGTSQTCHSMCAMCRTRRNCRASRTWLQACGEVPQPKLRQSSGAEGIGVEWPWPAFDGVWAVVCKREGGEHEGAETGCSEDETTMSRELKESRGGRR